MAFIAMLFVVFCALVGVVLLGLSYALLKKIRQDLAQHACRCSVNNCLSSGCCEQPAAK